MGMQKHSQNVCARRLICSREICPVNWVWVEIKFAPLQTSQIAEYFTGNSCKQPILKMDGFFYFNCYPHPIGPVICFRTNSFNTDWTVSACGWLGAISAQDWCVQCVVQHSRLAHSPGWGALQRDSFGARWPRGIVDVPHPTEEGNWLCDALTLVTDHLAVHTAEGGAVQREQTNHGRVIQRK